MLSCCFLFAQVFFMVVIIAWLVDGLNNRDMSLFEWVEAICDDFFIWFLTSMAKGSLSVVKDHVINLFFG